MKEIRDQEKWQVTPGLLMRRLGDCTIGGKILLKIPVAPKKPDPQNL